MKRWLAALLGLLLVLAALISVALVGLALTDGGTRFLAAQAERLLPLRLGGVSGTLGRRFAVERLVVLLPQQEIRVEDLKVELGLWSLLFDNRLEIDAVRAAAVRVVERPGATSPDPQSPPIALRLPDLPFELVLGELRIAELDVAGAPVVSLSGAADWDGRRLAVRELQLVGQDVELAVAGTLSAGARPVLDAVLEWALPVAGWAGRGELAGRVDQLQVVHKVTRPDALELVGTVDLSVPLEPGFDFTVTAAAIARDAWSVTGLSLRAIGRPDAFTAELSGQVDAGRGGRFPLRLELSGSAAGPVEFEAEARPLDGRVQATGSIGWTNGLAVAVRGNGRDLALESLLDGYTGSLGAQFAVDYGSDGFDVTLDELSGLLDGRALTGQARFKGQLDGAWTVPVAELEIGDNRVALRGSWQDGALAIVGAVEAPALDQLGWPVRGAVTADVELAGVWPELGGDIQFRSPMLGVEGYEVKTLEGRASLAAGTIAGQIAAARIAAEAVAIEALTLDLAGSIDALTWRLDWSHGRARGALTQLPDGQRLRVEHLLAELAGIAFETEDPLVLERRVATVTAEPVCIAAAAARACVERFRLHEGRIETVGSLDRLPVGILPIPLPVALADTSFVEGRWDLAGAGTQWRGSLALAVRQLGIELPGEADQVLALPDIELTAAFDGLTLAARITAEDDAVRLGGDVRLDALGREGRLDGRVALQFKDIGWLAELDSRIVELEGALEAHLDLSGQLEAPIVVGRLDLADGAVALQDPEFRLDGIGASLEIAADGAFTLTASGIQGEGRVELDGRGSGLFGDALEAELALRSSGLRASHPQFAVAVGTDLALTLREGIVRVTGSIDLPRAEVRLNTLPASVPQPSADVVVVGREASAGPAVPNRLRLNVRVRLGRNVSLRALGIDARLRGDLRVRRDARGQTSVRGTLDVAGGTLSAQGQTLAIESGVVVYNGPVGNPYVDVRAVRAIEDAAMPVKVGLRIQGDANRLTSTVISEPAMAENRALAFLVLGRDIDQQSDTDSSQLVAAALNLGLSRSKSLIAELQRATGLDELSAVAEGQDSFAIAAGKRITKNLYLRYTYNTLTALGSILVSFELSDRWHLEARSGEHSAMDILYRIAR